MLMVKRFGHRWRAKKENQTKVIMNIIRDA